MSQIASLFNGAQLGISFLSECEVFGKTRQMWVGRLHNPPIFKNIMQVFPTTTVSFHVITNAITKIHDIHKHDII